MFNPLPGSRSSLLALFAVTLLLNTEAVADNLAEDKAKVGFIFNFTKYTNWPDKVMDKNELLVCSLSARPLSGRLSSLQGLQVQGQVVQLRLSARATEWQDCHVLFIAAEDAQHLDSVLKTIARLPVLSISDAPDFSEAGGIIGLNLRDGRIRFVINQGAARQAGIRLSSHLMKLAEKVLP
jgi:hypothetical protein